MSLLRGFNRRTKRKAYVLDISHGSPCQSLTFVFSVHPKQVGDLSESTLIEDKKSVETKTIQSSNVFCELQERLHVKGLVKNAYTPLIDRNETPNLII